MHDKASISGSYINRWHEHTKNWRHPLEREAVVAGASPGSGNIGESIATLLGNEGFAVTCVDRDNSDGRAIEGWEFASSIDTLVLAQGRTRLDWIENQGRPDIHNVIHDTLTASVLATSNFVNATLAEPWIKTIVYVGSMAHQAVLNGSAPYCAAKAGLAHFARCMAWELAPKGYRVFIVHPSNTEGTPMTEATIQGLERYRNLSREDAENYWGAIKAQPDWLSSREIAAIVADLCTKQDNRWLAGAQLNLGGGTR